MLRDLNALAVQHGGQEHVHSSAVLEAMHPGARHELLALAERGWARRTGADGWSITPSGRSEMDRREGGEEENS